MDSEKNFSKKHPDSSRESSGLQVERLQSQRQQQGYSGSTLAERVDWGGTSGGEDNDDELRSSASGDSAALETTCQKRRQHNADADQASRRECLRWHKHPMAQDMQEKPLSLVTQVAMRNARRSERSHACSPALAA
jgi:hypothetical protein